jgi:hypothetical protein
VLTVSVYWICVKVAVAALFPLTVSVAGFTLPERSPPQPEKLDPAEGVAVNVTTVP